MLIALTVLTAFMLLAPGYLVFKTKLSTWAHYLAATIPVLYVIAVWRLGKLLLKTSNCSGLIVEQTKCMLNGLNVAPLLGYGLLSMLVLILVATPISVALLIKAGFIHIDYHYNRKHEDANTPK